MIFNEIFINTLNILPKEIFVIPLIFLVLVLLMLLYRLNRLMKAGMNDIDKMDGEQFEKYLEILFNKDGYVVNYVGASNKFQGDSGADLILEKSGVKTAVQVKRWKGVVTEKAVQEVVASKAVYGCTNSMVVTNSYFSKHAINLAKANNVVLWDRNSLTSNIIRVNRRK